MDPASLAISIVALYTTCRDCYNFFTAVKTAGTESSAQLRELEIQKSILKAWGFHWQIQNEDGSDLEHPNHAFARKGTQLHEYLLRNRFKAEGVFNTLSALADTLSNQEKLVKRYGIQLQPANGIQDGWQSTNNVQLAIQNATIENVKPVISEVKNRLSVLNKFKWALKDRDSFKKLIADLRSHSESLYRLCPESSFGSMNIYLTMDCLARQESPVGLKWTSTLATRQAEVDENSPSVREGYKLLASAATLKASVNENRGVEQADTKTLTSIDEEQREMLYLGKGLALFEGQVVYVEMRDYRGPPLELTPEQKQQMKRRRARLFKSSAMDRKRRRPYDKASMDQIHKYSSSNKSEKDVEPIAMIRPADPEIRALIRNFFNTFQGANKRESIYGLDIAGMIDHTEGEHKGFCSILYKLPGTIGVLSRERPAENLKLRAPVTLGSLLRNTQKEHVRSALGARFELARKLVRAVCLLHSSGWLHKNIRAESVMFFPEHVSALQEDLYEIKFEIDITKPILMGYIFSRPDDIISQTNSAAARQIEESSSIDPPRIPHITHKTSTRTWDDPLDVEAKLKRRPGPPKRNRIFGRNMLEEGEEPRSTKEANISGFTLDYYQHPAKHANPKRLYRHAYDVYSLGILLLEIGLWKKLRGPRITFDDSSDEYISVDEEEEEDHYEQRRQICRDYLERLRSACGDIYADVVLSCLMTDSSDDEVATASQRELCARIVADLECCQA